MRRLGKWLSIGALVLLMLMFVWNETVPSASVCVDSEGDREKIRMMTFQALDDAYKDQVKHLYEIWMRDPHGQPQRAQAGIANAISAWVSASKNANLFNPSECVK